MRGARPAERILGGSPTTTGTDPVAVGEPMVVEPSPPASVEVGDPSKVPYRSHGKVFFRWKGGDYVCSGTVVTSEFESLVVTAGHCVFDEGSFSSRLMFVPAYDSGDAPFGEWTASELFTTTGWINGWEDDDLRFDVGMAVISPQSGETIQDAVGARGIEFNRDPSSLDIEAIGHPAGDPFDGESMILCASDVLYRDEEAGIPAPMAIDCDMTGGSSGGGWVIEGAKVNSVVSYGYPDLPDVLFGPYFGDAVQTLYVTAGGTEPGPGPDPEEPIDHAIGLTLTMRGHLRATGRMSVPDGYLPCRRNAPIRIFRTTGSASEVFVKKTTTGDDGRFSIAVPDRAGRYYAFGPEGGVDELNNCLEAFSGYSRHRH